MWKERINKINFLVLCLLSCFPVLNVKVTVVLIIVFTVISVLSGLAYGLKTINSIRIKEALLLLAPFLLIFFRTYVTDRSEDALFYLEVSTSLLVFPVAFFLSPVAYTKKQKDLLCLLFAGATFAIVFFGEIQTAIKLMEHVGPGKFWPAISDVFKDASFPYLFRTEFEEQTHLHPTYASVFLGISILLLLDRFLKTFQTIPPRGKMFFVLALGAFILMQAMLASRTPFIATMICSIVLIFIYQRKKIYTLYALAGILFLSILMMWLVPSISSRFKEISFSNTGMPSATNENSFNIRVGIYQCSTTIISENWLWGIGPGNVQKELNRCYSRISKEVYDQKNYNTHNQFLDYWAGIGIAGPLLLLVILGYTSVKNLRLKNPVVLVLSLLFLIAMLTENILIRQNGIVTFAYFTSLFFFTRCATDEKVKPLKTSNNLSSVADESTNLL